MPTAQLTTAAVERLLNSVLSLDPDSQPRLAALKGKQLAVELDILPWPLVLAFSEQVDVMTLPDAQTKSEQVDCFISLSVETLPKLADTSQLSKLIKQNALSLEGDLQVAQDVSALFKGLDIDWEEQLSRHTTDVFAHSVFVAFKGVKQRFNQDAAKLKRMLSEGAIEEKQLAAHPLAVAHFCDQVDELRSATARLEARVKLLEQQH